MKYFKFVFPVLAQVIMGIFVCASVSASQMEKENKGYLQYAKELNNAITECETNYKLLFLSTLLLDNHLQGVKDATQTVDSSSDLSGLEVGDFYKDIVVSKKLGAVVHSITEIGRIHEIAASAKYQAKDLISLKENVRVVEIVLNEMEHTHAWGYSELEPMIKAVSASLSEVWGRLAVKESSIITNLQELVEISELIK